MAETDAPQLQALAELCYRDTYKHTLTGPEIQRRISTRYRLEDFVKLLSDAHQIFWGVRIEKQLVGYVQLSNNKPKAECLEISRIYVHPEFKGRGIGKALMAKAEAVCLKLKLEGLSLHCFDQNQAALSFYTQCGFKVTGEDRFEILPGFKRVDVVMTKMLRP